MSLYAMHVCLGQNRIELKTFMRLSEAKADFVGALQRTLVKEIKKLGVIHYLCLIILSSILLLVRYL